MPIFSGRFSQVNLAELVRTILLSRKTGCLKIKDGAQEGFLAVEEGMLIHAEMGPYTALDALFQFVIWREAHFDFHEQALPSDMPRELKVYDSQVLVAGLADKVRAVATHPVY